MARAVIEIPDDNKRDIYWVKGKRIANLIGEYKVLAVLPEGHGRLIDADKLKVDLVKTYEKVPTEKALLFVSLLLDNNEEVPTVIEADKENGNVKLC